jgi:hypothetical protein
MPRMGRPPLGAKLVDDLEASPLAKSRLRAILSTITGESSATEAARSLHCNQARLYAMRGRTLQEAAQGLEPRKPGRKPTQVDPKDEEIARLQHELERVQHVLETVTARLELALAGVGARQKKRRPRAT